MEQITIENFLREYFINNNSNLCIHTPTKEIFKKVCEALNIELLKLKSSEILKLRSSEINSNIGDALHRLTSLRLNLDIISITKTMCIFNYISIGDINQAKINGYKIYKI